MAFEHKSVLLDESIENLNIKENGIYVDGTLGGGGHSYEIAKKLKNGQLIGIDQDEAAIKAASIRLSEFNEIVTIVRSNYSEMKSVVNNQGVLAVDGILLDLGVSSYHIDTISRGFSYKSDAPLDMRMDTRVEMTARDIVNGYSEMELFRIIRDFGEDKFAKNIAKHIVRVRQIRPIETTFELNEAIKAAIPMKIRKNTGHPAKKTFQAIRIELNKELDVLKNTLDDFVELLSPGGRLCIITFHSLEDRIVKSCFRVYENPCTCPHDFPICICGNKPRGKIISRKPIIPSDEEIVFNKRARSAKLRVFEKI